MRHREVERWWHNAMLVPECSFARRRSYRVTMRSLDMHIGEPSLASVRGEEAFNAEHRVTSKPSGGRTFVNSLD
jgi:hypothetical protein